MASGSGFPVPVDGLLSTFFITVGLFAVSRHFYADVFGYEALMKESREREDRQHLDDHESVEGADGGQAGRHAGPAIR
ncbi:hypothetical protein [Streptomyces olivaceoviridis]|uniref:hypothetical protein n=1 Tax=Streptomyces olivaceoviridis TaxID=1921 RepID=UPI0033B3A3C2